MRVFLDEGAYPPERAHETDAGLDIRARHGQIICSKASAVFHTGVHIDLPEGTAGLLVSKSGLYTKHDLISTGLIDEGYTGEIIVKVTNLGDFDYMIGKGDKISQLVIIPVRYESVEIVSEIWKSKGRGTGGFGSTGR